MMPVHPAGNDPRPSLVGERDVRPVIAVTARRIPTSVIVVGLAIAAALLFSLLDAHRRTATVPATRVAVNDPYAKATVVESPLFVPSVSATIPSRRLINPAPPLAPADQPRIPPAPAFVPPSQMTPPIQPYVAAQPPPSRSTGDAIIFDSSGASGGDSVPSLPPGVMGGGGPASAESSSPRVRAGVLRNPGKTVPQGTLIPAVLETALDSTRAGLVRALVQSDVVSFDGQRVLISRGSRLIGEYRSELEPGQNRANVVWTRLVRPDGALIALSSPAADTLGRGGIKGSVNSHFLERFGAAILQSTLDVGVALARRAGNNSGVLINASGLGSASQAISSGNQVRSTLTVRQGTALTVFVARDLDFTAVER